MIPYLQEGENNSNDNVFLIRNRTGDGNSLCLDCQYQYPGYDIVLLICTMLPLGETEKYKFSLYFFLTSTYESISI